MNPISDTAFYCTGVRMLDARKRHSVCNDFYAERFMDKHGKRVLQKFKYDVFPNITNAVRHRIIDDIIRDKLKDNGDMPIFIIGCGFDSRAFRLPAGKWIEVDEPQIINVKNEKLPINDCHNPLQRIAINFSEESIKDKLSPHQNDEPCLIIIEGVLLYLEEETIKELLTNLQLLFPKHTIVCDLMTKSFFNRYAKIMHKKFSRMGAIFRYIVSNPEDRFKIQGYKHTNRISIVKKGVELKALPFIPDFLLNTLLESLKDGYAIYTFDFNQAG